METKISFLGELIPLDAVVKRDGTLVSWPVIFSIWAGIALIMTAQNHVYQSALHLTFPDIHASWSDSFRFPLLECLFWAILTPGLLRLSRKLPLFGRGWAKRLTFLMLVNFALEPVHAFYRLPFHTFVYPYMARIPFVRLLRYYLLGNSLNDLWVFWTIVGIGQLISYYGRLMDREKDLATAQLQALTAQLQPHFLFNVLNSVSSLMREDVEAADDMIARLSELMRTTLKSKSPHETSLRDELQVVNTYVEIERMRFPDRLNFAVNADSQVLDAAVPTLILLPIIENSIRYAVAPRTSPGTVGILAIRERDNLVISVDDDGPGIPSAPTFTEGLGLANTRARLKRYYAEMASMSYRNLERGGFEVTLRMPLTLRPTDFVHDSDAHC